MTIQVDNALPPNVVEIGNEITQGVVDGLMSASPSPSSSNPYLTVNGATFLPLAGGTMDYNANIILGVYDVSEARTVINKGTIGVYFDEASYVTTVGAGGITLAEQGGDTTQINQHGIVFPDSTIQTTAATAPAFATDAEVRAGTSASTVLSPLNGQQLRPIYDYGFFDLGSYSWSSAVSGGFFVQSGANIGKFVNTNTAIGYGVGYISVQNATRGGAAGSTTIDWSKKVILSTRVQFQNPSSTNTVHRIMLGKSTAATVAGDLAIRGIGVKRTGTGALTLMVHDGTTLSTSATSFTPTSSVIYDLTLVSDGAGTTTCFINGSSVGTITGSPTTLGTGNNSGFFYESENTAVVTASGQIYLSYPRVSFGF